MNENGFEDPIIVIVVVMIVAIVLFLSVTLLNSGCLTLCKQHIDLVVQQDCIEKCNKPFAIIGDILSLFPH